MGWWCAQLSFWGAAGVLAALGVVEAISAFRAARRERTAEHGLGEIAG